MELVVNTEKKAVIHKASASSNKIVCIISAIAKILFFVGIVVGGIYALVNCLSPTLSIVRVNGVPQKDISWIIISTSCIVVPCLVFSASLHTLAKTLAGSSNAARVDEQLLVSNEFVRYSFRIKHQSLSSERRVVTIPFSEITLVDYDNKTETLIFKGNILSEYFDDYRQKRSNYVTTLEKFVIGDYFSPGLRDTLISRGVMNN